MSIPNYPGNSHASKRTTEEKDIKRVTSGEVIRKKKTLRSQFRETFVAGDVKSSVGYALYDVGVPLLRDLVLEMFHSGMDKLFLGDSRRRGGFTPTADPRTGPIPYNRISGPSVRMLGPARAMSREARARHNFDEIVLVSRADAEEVLDRLQDVVNKYDVATVADLYELVGTASSHSDHKWGWTSLRGIGVTSTRDGYLLDLPAPHAL